MGMNGNDLNLTFTAAGAAVPEPGTWAAAALLLGAAAFISRPLVLLPVQPTADDANE